MACGRGRGIFPVQRVDRASSYKKGGAAESKSKNEIEESHCLNLVTLLPIWIADQRTERARKRWKHIILPLSSAGQTMQAWTCVIFA